MPHVSIILELIFMKMYNFVPKTTDSNERKE